MFKIYRILTLSILFSFIITGCTTGGGSDLSWPVTTYENYICGSSNIPHKPSCLTWAVNSDGGFSSGNAFSACRQSVANYTDALDEYYICSNNKLKDIFDSLIKEVPATYNCYVSYFKNRSEGDPSSECPAVNVPKFHAPYEAEGLVTGLGVPSCVEHNSSPKYIYKLDDCREQVKMFTGKGDFSYSFRAKSAQDQYDIYLKNLKRVLDQKANEVISKFNCISKGSKYCN